MNRIFRCALSSAALLAAVALGGPADARSVPASAGGARLAADVPCFLEYWGYVENTCSTMKEYMVPLTADNDGWFTLDVSGLASSMSNMVTCGAFSINKERTSFYQPSPMTNIAAVGAPSSVVVSGYRPGFGGAWAYCHINPGGRVHVVTF